MGVRKAACYSKMKVVPYTRKSKVKRKSYIKTVPNTKVVKLRLGDLKGFRNGKYKNVFKIISEEDVQIRDLSLEAVRQYLNRKLSEIFGNEFYLEVKVYPHHIIRENRMLTGAGADRMSTGMSMSFGTTIGRAALVKKGKELFVVAVSENKKESEIRKIFDSIRAKLPCKILVSLEKIS